MKREDLFEAIGQVDDDLLDENVAPAGSIFWRYVAGITTAAACIAVIFGTAAWAQRFERNSLPEPAASVEKSLPAVTEPASVETVLVEIPDENSTEIVPVETVEKEPELLPPTEEISTIAPDTVENEVVLTETETKPEPKETDAEIPQWKTLYQELAETFSTEENRFSLVNINGDTIPELAVSPVEGSRVSLFTYADGEIFTVMDDLSWDISGNNGYYYVPGENMIVFRNNSDAGLHVCYHFCRMGADYQFEQFSKIDVLHFTDENDNYEWDPDEPYDPEMLEAQYFLDGEEITEEEAAGYKDYVIGEYPLLRGEQDYTDFQAQLQYYNE